MKKEQPFEYFYIILISIVPLLVVLLSMWFVGFVLSSIVP